jgi:hypothetical protein
MNDLQPTPTYDPYVSRFLERQRAEGLALAAASDLIELEEHPFAPPNFVVTFRCKGLVRSPDGEIEEANFFQAGIWFPPDYLRRADPFEVLRWFAPSNIWHPNISSTVPLVCVGKIAPGTTLVELILQLYDIITYRKYTPREDDALNHACCAWARDNQRRFPVDQRPLRRKPLGLEVTPL